MQKNKFIIEGEKDKKFFNKTYDKIFNQYWYPDYFVNEGFSIFLFKQETVYPSSIEKLESKSSSDVKNESFLEEDILDDLNISTLSNKIMSFLISCFDESQILVKAFDFTKEEPIRNLILPIKTFKEVYISRVEKLMLSNSEITSDMGMVVFGDSSQWGYYLGEELYGNFNLEEFELFIITKEKEQDLIQFINKKYPNYIIEQENDNDLFRNYIDKKNNLFKIFEA